MNRVFMTVLLALAMAAPAFAHEGVHHAKGVIKELTAEKIVLTEATGKDVAFVITKATEFFHGGDGHGQHGQRYDDRPLRSQRRR